MEYYYVRFIHYDDIWDMKFDMDIPIVNLPPEHYIFKLEKEIGKPVYDYEIDPFKDEIFITLDMKRQIWRVIEKALNARIDIEAHLEVHFRPYPEKMRLLEKAVKIFGLL